jgi:hypothetical protein
MTDPFNPTAANIEAAQKCQHAIFFEETKKEGPITFSEPVPSGASPEGRTIDEIKCSFNQDSRAHANLCVYGRSEGVRCPLGLERRR